jgi:hypothetical protein
MKIYDISGFRFPYHNKPDIVCAVTDNPYPYRCVYARPQQHRYLFRNQGGIDLLVYITKSDLPDGGKMATIEMHSKNDLTKRQLPTMTNVGYATKTWSTAANILKDHIREHGSDVTEILMAASTDLDSRIRLFDSLMLRAGDFVGGFESSHTEIEGSIKRYYLKRIQPEAS